MKKSELRKFVRDEILNEASIGRVYQHIKGSESWGIISAFRGGLSKRENLSRHRKLAGDVRGLGLGFFKLEGHWVGDDGVEKELTLFVPNVDIKALVRLMKKYDQDAVIYSGSETKNNITLYYKSGKKEKIGSFSPDKVSSAYSKVKGHNFVFEGFHYTPNTWMESVIDQKRG